MPNVSALNGPFSGSKIDTFQQQCQKNRLPDVIWLPRNTLHAAHLVAFYVTVAVLLVLNPLNPELNPICYLLALLGAHHFLHVSRIRVKLLTYRRLMLYVYIWSTHS